MLRGVSQCGEVGDRGNGLPDSVVFVTFLGFSGHESGVVEPRRLQVMLERIHEGMSKRKSRKIGVCFSHDHASYCVFL